MSAPERTAYEAAWKRRTQTGVNSAELLVEELRNHGAGPAWLDPESEACIWMFDCWERGVPPNRMPIEALKKAPEAFGHIFRAYRAIWKAFR